MGGWKKGHLHRGETEAHIVPTSTSLHYPPALTHLAQVSPLYLACWFNQTEFALALVRAGALPDLAARRSRNGRLLLATFTEGGRFFTPLYPAALVYNHRGAELCKALLDAGATVGLGASPLIRTKTR